MSQQEKMATRIGAARHMVSKADDLQAAPDRLFTTEETAKMLGVAVGTLNRARVYGNTEYPAYVKIGKSVRYKASTIARFLESRPEYQSTSQEEVTA